MPNLFPARRGTNNPVKGDLRKTIRSQVQQAAVPEGTRRQVRGARTKAAG
jgi:hypothetical protein